MGDAGQRRCLQQFLTPCHRSAAAAATTTIAAATRSCLPAPTRVLALHPPAVGSHGGSEGSAVFISNLQWWTTDVELEALCATFGHVLGIRFLDDKACGKSRGMAIVEFAEGEAAAACIAGLSGWVEPQAL